MNWINIILQLLLHTCWTKNVLSQSNTDSKGPIDFTVIDDSTISQAKKSNDGLPLDVNVNFDVLGSRVSLNLKRNPKLSGAKDVYVIRKSESGIPVILHDAIVEPEVFGEYQDPTNGAIFTLSCPKDNMENITDNCNATMEGTFRMGKEEFRMSPMEETALGRVRRSAPGHLWKKAKKIATAADEFSKVYGIYRTEASAGTPTDFKEDTPMVTGKVAAFGREAKIVRENVLPGGRQYNLEILAVVDYGIYERFYKASRRGTEEAKDNEAKYNLKKYFSHVFNGVDMLYQTIDDPEFSMSVAVSGFVIADSPDVSPWTTPHIDRNLDGRHDLLVSIPLDELLRWSFNARNIPENDHMMLLTDYDLYSVDSGRKDKRTAGYARVGSVCSMDSVSVIEDHGGFQSINAAAHELGHALGSRHDGRTNSCDPNDQYIMTAHGGFETASTRTNPWRFSTCSIAYFKDYVSRLPRRHCLSDPVDIFDRAQYLQFVSTYPGQDYDPNEQCQDILGLDSYYGWGPELGKFGDICTEMSCKVPGASRSYRVYKAATGTSCGDKRWCIEGKCVFDEKAPTKDPSCVFGDIQRRFGNGQSCRQYMMDNPMRCYDSFYSTRCCDTCERLNTGVRGCEYGDKFLNCRTSGCFDPSYARDCCSTCGLAPHPVLRDPPTTSQPTTRQPWVPPPRPTTRNPWTPRPMATTRNPWTPRPMATTRNPWTPRPMATTRNPWTPRPMRTTRTPWTPRPTTRGLPPKIPPLPTEAPDKPSGRSGQCIMKDARFLLVFSCSSLPSLFGENACDNALVARYCCERCPEKGHSTCVDAPDCRLQYARQCYEPEAKQKCCKTCRRFETGIPGCEYGDKIRSCERYAGELGISRVCSQYKDYCCGLCNALSTSNEASSVNDIAKPIAAIPDLVPGPTKLSDTSPSLGDIGSGDSNGNPKPGKGKGRGKGKGNGKGNNKGNNKTNNNNNRNNGKGPGRSNKNNENPGGVHIGLSRIPSLMNFNMSSSSDPFQDIRDTPGRVVHTIVFRPVRRRGGIARPVGPPQSDGMIRRFNFVIG